MKLCILVYFCISPRTPAYTHVSFIFDAYDKYSFPSHAHHPCIPQYILVMLFFRPHVCMIGYSYLRYIYIIYIYLSVPLCLTVRKTAEHCRDSLGNSQALPSASSYRNVLTSIDKTFRNASTNVS